MKNQPAFLGVEKGGPILKTVLKINVEKSIISLSFVVNYLGRHEAGMQ